MRSLRQVKSATIRFCSLTSLLIAGIFLLTIGVATAGLVQSGVVATTSPDWSSGAHSVISVDPVGGPRSVQNNLLPTISDITVVAFGKYFYRIERFQSDNVTKFDVNAPSTPVWQFSTMDAGEQQSSNPHDLIFLNSQKAYLMRYGSSKAWIVNPSATSQDQFKIGELDLSAYSDADGPPEMHSAVIADGKLFIILQRLEYWCPSTDAYVAVFDTSTDTEIDTGKGANGRKGIPLPIRNPLSIQYLPENHKIYVQGAGAFPGFCPSEYEYTGGIVTIDPTTYDTNMILDDGTASSHPYGTISGMLVASPSKGYFVGYDGWGDNTLYQFIPDTGEVFGAVPGFQHISIAGMESGTYLDKNQMLWICNQSDYTVDILNTEDNSIDESVSTLLSPQKVVFCTDGGLLPPKFGVTVDGYTVSFHWNVVSGADGYTLIVAGPFLRWMKTFDMKDRTTINWTLPFPYAFYAAVIAYNSENSSDLSNVAFVVVR